MLSRDGVDGMMCLMVTAPMLRHNVYWPVEPVLYSHDAEGSGGTAVGFDKPEPGG